jgi:flagellar motor switch protein FliG
MDVLLQLFNDKELDRIIGKCEDIKSTSKEEISNIINYFHELNFDDTYIRFIIMNNPSFLTRSSTKIREIIEALMEYGIEDLDLCIYLYPIILNKSLYEIDNFYIKKHLEGLSNEDINLILETEPYLIDN